MSTTRSGSVVTSTWRLPSSTLQSALPGRRSPSRAPGRPRTALWRPFRGNGRHSACAKRTGADLEPREAGRVHAGLLEDLLDRLALVLRELLLEEHVVLEERVDAALDDPRQRLLGLALLAGLLLGDPPLRRDDVGRHGVPGEVARSHRRRVHRDVLGDVAGPVGRHQDADLRGQVGARPVQVARDVRSLEPGDATNLDLLADGRVRPGEELGHAGAGLDLAVEQGLRVAGADLDRLVEDPVGESDERLALGHEVGLAVDLDQRPDAALDVRGDEAVGGRPVAALGGARLTLDPQELDGLLEVALGRLERLLRVHHSCARAVTQPLDVGRRDVRHGGSVSSCLSGWWGGRPQAGSPASATACTASPAGTPSGVIASVATGSDRTPSSASAVVSTPTPPSSAGSPASLPSPAVAWAAAGGSLDAPVASSAAASAVGTTAAWPSRSSRSHSASGSSPATAPDSGLGSPPRERGLRASAAAAAPTR